MNHFVYRVYYQWRGPSDTNPFGSELNFDEIADAFRNLLSGIIHRLEDREAVVEISEPPQGVTEAVLSVRTIASCASLVSALVPALKDCHLYGEPLDESR